jgi:hypothetical protein
VKTIRNKWKYLREYFQKETKNVVKPKSRAAGQDIPKTSSWQYYNMMLFLEDMLFSEKLESCLHDSSVSELFGSQDTSFGYHDGENLIAEVPYALSMRNTSFRPCNVSSLSSEETINHSCGSKKKRKMTLDNTDTEIMIEKKKLELRDMKRDEDDNLLF